MKMKTCSAGADCIHKGGAVQPIENFYKRGNNDGDRFARCKSCKIEYQRNYDNLDACLNNKERIAELKKSTKKSRLGKIYTLIINSRISRSDFRAIMREVEL